MTAVEVDAIAPAPRARVRWWQVVVLVAGVALLAGALVFMATSTSDRDQAVATRRRRAHALADAKLAADNTQTDLEDLQTERGNVQQQIETFIASADRMLALSDQQAAESTTTQRLGSDPTVAPEEYNASVGRSNALLDQYNAERDLFVKLGFKLFGFGDDDAQSVSFSSGARASGGRTAPR